MADLYGNYFQNLIDNHILVLFTIIIGGYMLGRIKIKGLGLGSSGVLLLAIVFGHFGAKISPDVKTLGLIMFVTAVGFIAGPTFFRNFKKNAISYVLLGLVITVLGAGSCIAIKFIAGIPTDLALGMMVGSLTSTPGLSAAIEATSSLASIGYGIAYPFGVISVVVFVQIMPKLLKTDMDAERAQYAKVDAETMEQAIDPKPIKKLFKFDSIGYFAFALAIALGLILASILVPLPGGGVFSLGATGGPLIIGLVLGHFGKIGPVDITIKKSTLESLRELGLILFLAGAGVEAGAGFVETLVEYGAILFLYGVPMALIPMIGGFFVAKYAFKLSTFNTLGSITGGMTSTPALGTLIEVAGTDDVASAYAATYPIALVAVVLSAQFIGMIP